MKRCGISFETLADYNDGRADERASEQVREHINAGCDQCLEGLAWLQRAAHTLRAAADVRFPRP